MRCSAFDSAARRNDYGWTDVWLGATLNEEMNVTTFYAHNRLVLGDT